MSVQAGLCFYLCENLSYSQFKLSCVLNSWRYLFACLIRKEDCKKSLKTFSPWKNKHGRWVVHGGAGMCYTPHVPLCLSREGTWSILGASVFLFFKKQISESRYSDFFPLCKTSASTGGLRLFIPSLTHSWFVTGFWHGLHIPNLSCHSENVLRS